MKQLAWLHAAPRQAKKLNQPTETKSPMTRMQALHAAGSAVPLPEAGIASHLVGYLFDIGPVGHGAMAAVPLSWPEIRAWEQATGIELATWEARAIRQLSGDYLSMSQLAEAPDCPAPWVDPGDHERRAAVADKVRAVFGRRH